MENYYLKLSHGFNAFPNVFSAISSQGTPLCIFHRYACLYKSHVGCTDVSSCQYCWCKPSYSHRYHICTVFLAYESAYALAVGVFVWLFCHKFCKQMVSHLYEYSHVRLDSLLDWTPSHNNCIWTAKLTSVCADGLSNFQCLRIFCHIHCIDATICLHEVLARAY